MKKINCAVYVRKSTEKGLEQEFNSLNNQEEACRAYIASQTYQGWEYFKTYEDGGISGGTMDRPGLQQMIKDIKSEYINIVLVYKVDRLSRSIMDFHNMMKEFEKYNCNFVSITQAFDTSNSMGKLTLNMLLSFAQFEREVSAERVRDKIAATKAKGMWAGGTPPLGYDIIDKKLIVNSIEAEVVRILFSKYLELKTLRGVMEWIRQQGIKKKSWRMKNGEVKGGGEFHIARLHWLLTRKVYIGMIEHYRNKKVYQGVHEPIVDKELFEAVQEQLGRRYEKNEERKKYLYSQGLLHSKFFTADNRIFKFSNSKKSERRFNYYYIKGENGICLPVEQIDSFANKAVNNILDMDLKELGNEILGQDMKLLIKKIPQIKNENIKAFLDKAIYLVKDNVSELIIYINIDEFIKFLRSHSVDDYYNQKVKKAENISISEDKKHIVIKTEFVIDNQSKTRLENGPLKNALTITEMNEGLVRGLALGWTYFKELNSGKTLHELEKEVGQNHRTIDRYVNLTYLSPNIVDDIFNNKNPKNLRLKDLKTLAYTSINFKDQEREWGLCDGIIKYIGQPEGMRICCIKRKNDKV
jgi:DNA invertase Pin-like site-specific DNA recombinase